MSQFRVYRDNSADAVCLSGIFIDEYMTDANDAQLKIYLYLLRILGSGRDCGVSVLADRFNYTEKDVIRALTYWEKKGLLTQEKEDGALVGIRLMDPVSRKEAPSQEPAPAKAPAPSEEKQPSPEPEVRSFQSERSYSADEINEFRSRADTAELLFVVEQYLGKTLTRREVETLIFFMDELHFSSDMIDYLFEYCLSRDKKSFRYIKAVAIAWAEEGITTPEEAAARSEKYNKKVYDIMKLLGKSSSPTRIEVDYITKWTEEMGFSMEVISEACRRTVDNTDSNRFKYAHAILSDWHAKKVHSVSDIQRLDETHDLSASGRTGNNTPAAKSSPAEKPQYKRFTQRSYDFDKLEKELFVNN